MLDLEAIFGSDDDPVIGAVATAPVETAHERVPAPLGDNDDDPRSANVRLADDPWVDPWEAGVEFPEACRRCGSLELWLSFAGDLSGTAPGEWHCVHCDPPETARRLRGLAERLRTN
jgi:hypothetical protein